MAFENPPVLAPGLPGVDGRDNRQLTTEAALVGVKILGAQGVALKPGLDQPYVIVGRFNVTVPAGGVFTIPFNPAFPKECSMCIAMLDQAVLKWFPPTRTGASFQKTDGLGGVHAGGFVAFGC